MTFGVVLASFKPTTYRSLVRLGPFVVQFDAFPLPAWTYFGDVSVVHNEIDDVGRT
jgi:hypothetical protein